MNNPRENLKKFFNENITSYSYLFFAQVSVVAVIKYYKFETSQQKPIFLPFLWHLGLILPFIIPLIFELASLFTFNYTALRKNRISVILLNFFIIAVIIFAAVIS